MNASWINLTNRKAFLKIQLYGSSHDEHTHVCSRLRSRDPQDPRALLPGNYTFPQGNGCYFDF